MLRSVWCGRGSTQSVRASVYHFQEENGRTYHNYHNGSELILSPSPFANLKRKNGRTDMVFGIEYMIPNDEV
jgi:hypothetical protein